MNADRTTLSSCMQCKAVALSVALNLMLSRADMSKCIGSSPPTGVAGHTHAPLCSKLLAIWEEEEGNPGLLPPMHCAIPFPGVTMRRVLACRYSLSILMIKRDDNCYIML